MPEVFFVTYILMVFMFPVPSLAITLGAGTSYFLHKRQLLIRNQPADGRQLVWIHLLTGTANLVLSLALGWSLAFLVHVLIYKHFFLFLFNFTFCTIISLRWFDFTYALFRYFSLKLRTRPPTSDPNARFVMIYGLRSSPGWGLGMTPVFLDAGYLQPGETRVRFDGLFTQLDFELGSISLVETVSSEKIRLVPSPRHRLRNAEEYRIVVRDQFYPFKTRTIRDILFSQLSRLQLIEYPNRNFSFSAPNPTARKVERKAA